MDGMRATGMEVETANLLVLKFATQNLAVLSIRRQKRTLLNMLHSCSSSSDGGLIMSNGIGIGVVNNVLTVSLRKVV